MKSFKTVEIKRQELLKVICDRCERTLDGQEIDYGKFHTISYSGGYASDWPGDLQVAEVDLCEDCLRDLIEPFAKIKKAKLHS